MANRRGAVAPLGTYARGMARQATEAMRYGKIGPGSRVPKWRRRRGRHLGGEIVWTERYVLATDISSTFSNSNRKPQSNGWPRRDARITREHEGIEGDLRRGNLSRGTIYFPGQQKVLAGMHRALKPGGRIASIVYSTAENNKFFSIPVSIIRGRAQLPPPLPGQPGQFSLGGAGILEEAYRRAGFRETWVQTFLPLAVSARTACAREDRSGLSPMLSGCRAGGGMFGMRWTGNWAVEGPLVSRGSAWSWRWLK